MAVSGGGKSSNDRAVWLSRHILPIEPAVRRQLARWKLPHDLDVNDVIQEAYAKLARLEDVDDIRSPKSYFVQVARSIVMMHVRRSRVVSIQAVEQLDRLAIASDEPGPDVQVSDRQQLHLLGEMIANLPATSREAVTLRLVHDLSHREIGEKLGISANAVQKSLAKSLATFIRQLGRGGSDPHEASIVQDETADESPDVKARDQLSD